MSIQIRRPSNITADKMLELNSDLNRTTFEKAYAEQFITPHSKWSFKGLRARIWLAVCGTWKCENLAGAKTHKAERKAIKLYQTTLKDCVSHMATTRIADKTFAERLGVQHETLTVSDDVNIKDELTNSKLQAFWIALRGRVQYIKESNPELSIAEQSAFLQAGQEEMRNKIDEHNKGWFKPSIDNNSWKTHLHDVLADMSLKSVGNTVTAMDIQTQGIDTIVENEHALHLETFGLLDSKMTDPLKRKIRHEIISARKDDCDMRLGQLTRTDEIEKISAKRKEPLQKEIAKLQKDIDDLGRDLEKEIALYEKEIALKPDIETALSELTEAYGAIEKQQESPEKLIIEKRIRSTFTNQQLDQIYRVIVTQEDWVSADKRPDAMIDLCLNSREWVLAKIQKQSEEWKLLLSEQPIMESFRLLNTLLQDNTLYDTVDTTATRACRDSEKAKKEKALQSLKDKESQLKMEYTAIEKRGEKIENWINQRNEWQKELNQKKERLENIIPRVRQEVWAEPLPIEKELLDKSQANLNVRKNQFQAERERLDKVLVSLMNDGERYLSNMEVQCDALQINHVTLESLKDKLETQAIGISLCNDLERHERLQKMDSITRDIEKLNTLEKELAKTRDYIDAQLNETTKKIEKTKQEIRQNNLNYGKTETELQEISAQISKTVDNQLQNLAAVATVEVEEDFSEYDFAPYNSNLQHIDLDDAASGVDLPSVLDPSNPFFEESDDTTEVLNLYYDEDDIVPNPVVSQDKVGEGSVYRVKQFTDSQSFLVEIN